MMMTVTSLAAEFDAILGALREDPGDDLPRLALADLLEEQGDSLRLAGQVRSLYSGPEVCALYADAESLALCEGSAGLDDAQALALVRPAALGPEDVDTPGVVRRTVVAPPLLRPVLRLALPHAAIYEAIFAGSPGDAPADADFYDFEIRLPGSERALLSSSINARGSFRWVCVPGMHLQSGAGGFEVWARRHGAGAGRLSMQLAVAPAPGGGGATP